MQDAGAAIAPPAAAQHRWRAPRATRCSTCDMREGRPRCRRPARCACLFRSGCERRCTAAGDGATHPPLCATRRATDAGSAGRDPPSWSPCPHAAPVTGSGERTHVKASPPRGLRATVLTWPKDSRRKSPSSPATITALRCVSAAVTQKSFKSGKNCACMAAQNTQRRRTQNKRTRRRTSSTAMTSTASNSAAERRSYSVASSGSARHCCAREFCSVSRSLGVAPSRRRAPAAGRHG